MVFFLSEWTNQKLGDIVTLNPKEILKKGTLAKKVTMDMLKPFYRDIPTFETTEFKGGTKFRNGDTLMARITPCLENGKTAKVNILKDKEIGFGSTEYIVFRAIEGITDEDYVYYLVCSPIVRSPAIKSMIGSSGRQRVQTDVLQNLEISIPDLETQCKIGSLLRSLDDKIALNTAINENLEQQISEYFKSAFPDVLNSTGTDTLEKIISFSNGKKRPNEIGNIPVFGGNGILAYTNKSNSSNCVIIGRVGAYCGNVSLSLGDCWISDNAISAKSKITESQLFIFNLLKNAALPNRHIGTGQPLMTQGILNSILCNIPTIEKINDFESNVIPLQSLVSANIVENQCLVALRDMLIPKLMNGEIDVSNVGFECRVINNKNI